MDNLLSPYNLSWKSMGISTIFLGEHFTIISKPILKPKGLISSILFKMDFGKAKKPAIGSLTFIKGRARNFDMKAFILR